MADLTLMRVSFTPDETYGILLRGGVPFAVTLERPWRANRPNESCIPSGTYPCQRVLSPRFGDTFEVTRVDGRSHILFHKGNLSDDTEGCILVGEAYNYLGPKPGITASREGYEEFKRIQYGVDAFSLTITSVV